MGMTAVGSVLPRTGLTHALTHPDGPRWLRRQGPRKRPPDKPLLKRLKFARLVNQLIEVARERGVKLHGSRAKNMVLALMKFQQNPKCKSGIVYAGSEQLGELGGQSGRSVRRAQLDLEQIGAIIVHHFGGGRIRRQLPDGTWTTVSAANGFELNEEFLRKVQVADAESELPPPPAPAPAPSEPITQDPRLEARAAYWRELHAKAPP